VFNEFIRSKSQEKREGEGHGRRDLYSIGPYGRNLEPAGPEEIRTRLVTRPRGKKSSGGRISVRAGNPYRCDPGEEKGRKKVPGRERSEE